MLNSWWPTFLNCARRRAPLDTTRLEPEPEGEGTPVSPATAVLRDPGSDPRAELTFGTELWVYYGLVGLRPEEVRLDDHPEIRWYTVWLIPGQPQLEIAGIHWGISTRAYIGITGLNGGVNFKGIKWHRHDSFEAARTAFAAEADTYGLPHTYQDGWLAGSPSIDGAQDRRPWIPAP